MESCKSIQILTISSSSIYCNYTFAYFFILLLGTCMYKLLTLFGLSSFWRNVFTLKLFPREVGLHTVMSLILTTVTSPIDCNDSFRIRLRFRKEVELN